MRKRDASEARPSIFHTSVFILALLVLLAVLAVAVRRRRAAKAKS